VPLGTLYSIQDLGLTQADHLRLLVFDTAADRFLVSGYLVFDTGPWICLGRSPS